MPRAGQDARSIAAANLAWGVEQQTRLDDFAFWYACLRETMQRKVKTMQQCLDRKTPAQAAKPVARITR